METYDVIVIGAGQAGIVVARELVRKGLTPGRNMLVLDANEGPGGAWRHRWNTLTVGKAHGIANLPGLAMGEVDSSTPSSVAVADYFAAYEQTFGLGVVRPTRVKRIIDSGQLLALELDSGVVLRTRAIVSATGTWTAPFTPWLPGIARFAGEQLHTAQYAGPEDFRGKRTLVVGGGLSAVQLLLEIAPVTETTWSTRKPPQFVREAFAGDWGLGVEEKVRAKVLAGQTAGSVVGNTGIPPLAHYLQGVREGILVSRGPLAELTASSARFAGAHVPDDLVVPESWQPYARGTEKDFDIVFWNTGFRPALTHLAPLHLRNPGGALRMVDEVQTEDPRVFVVGYGSSASTVGAVRAGRAAARGVMRYLAGK